MQCGNNSPERPLTRVVEAGGTKRGNVRPGHEIRVIPVESSVSAVMLIAWMRRPTDRPIISCTALPEENSVIYFPFSSGSAAAVVRTIASQPWFLLPVYSYKSILFSAI